MREIKELLVLNVSYFVPGTFYAVFHLHLAKVPVVYYHFRVTEKEVESQELA